jgi:predicted transcriptional regulator
MFKTYDESKPVYNQMGYDDSLLELFWSKVNVVKLDDENADIDSCWEWIAGCAMDGYGRFWFDSKSINAHRFIYTCFNGPIPPKMCVCHACDNKPCVNPYHLWLGTSYENTHDMMNKNRLVVHKGSENGMSILTEGMVYEILEDIYNNKYTSNKEISIKYDIHVDTIMDILNNKSWRDISQDSCKKLNCDLKFLKSKISHKNLAKYIRVTEETICEIREELKRNIGLSQAKIAKKFGVSQPLVSLIYLNKR